MHNYIKRPEDVSKAVKLLRHQGVRVGPPMQTANAEMIFAIDDFTLTAGQLLELLDKNELDREGILKLLRKRVLRGQSH